MQNRILIVLENGQFKGASITSDTGAPAPLDQTALAALFPDLNVAALAEIERLQEVHAAEIAEIEASHAAEIAEIEASHAAEIAELEAALAAANAPASTPDEVTARQIRLALIEAGFSLADISTAINGDEAARVEWEYAATIRRDHPLVAVLGAALGLEAADIDAIFLSASTK